MSRREEIKKILLEMLLQYHEKNKMTFPTSDIPLNIINDFSEILESYFKEESFEALKKLVEE